MSQKITLSGSSDDCYSLEVGEQVFPQSYRPFKVTIDIQGQKVEAVMHYAHPDWECRIEAPDQALISVHQDREEEEEE